jgi:exosortase family protein XrtF
MSMLKEFIPAFRFLVTFLALYLGLNLVYGWWISSYNDQADWATNLVTHQTSFILNVFGEQTSSQPKSGAPTVLILKGSKTVISVYEGCNSINVMIVFVAFLFAFRGSWKSLSWFLPLGLFIIYIANLFRVFLLFYVAEYWQNYFYYVHKYIFTAALYLVVFALWWWWMEKVSGFSFKNFIASEKK